MQREFQYPIKIDKNNISGYKNVSKIAKHYQLSVFYEREIVLWNTNPVYKGVPLQKYLYLNRYKYLGKTPDNLSDIEILRAFTIAGVMKGYTTFNNELMQQFIDKYKPEYIYDPCAGWGERMLTAYKNGIGYLGVDINVKLQDGYARMISDYDMDMQQFIVADSSSYYPGVKYDAVVTCPPYWKQEIYTPYGAENLSYDQFLMWWNNVITCIDAGHPKFVCFQINQKYRSDLEQIVKNKGYYLLDEFRYTSVMSSHFTRKSGKNSKREYESFLVFTK